MGGAALIYMPDKYRTCPWIDRTNNIGMAIQRQCNKDCGLYDESINRCAFISIAIDMRILRLILENMEKKK